MKRKIQWMTYQDLRAVFYDETSKVGITELQKQTLRNRGLEEIDIP